MKVFWMDIESSGLDPKRHGIISLAYLVEIDGQVVSEDVLYSNCDDSIIEDSALAVNGFTREQIATFPNPEEMYAALRDTFAQYVDKFDRDDKFFAGGYNVAFDLSFLRQLWEDAGDKYFGSWFYFGALDPSALVPALKYAGALEGFTGGSAKLVDIARYLKIEPEGELHTAEADIRMTRECTLALVERMRGMR